MMRWIQEWWDAARAWWVADPVLARAAQRAAIRQEMDRHPVDRGEFWR